MRPPCLFAWRTLDLVSVRAQVEIKFVPFSSLLTVDFVFFLLQIRKVNKTIKISKTNIFNMCNESVDNKTNPNRSCEAQLVQKYGVYGLDSRAG